MISRIKTKFLHFLHAEAYQEQVLNLQNQLSTLEVKLQESDQAARDARRHLLDLQSRIESDSSTIRNQVLGELLASVAQPMVDLITYSRQNKPQKQFSVDATRAISDLLEGFMTYGASLLGQPGQMTLFDSEIHALTTPHETLAPGTTVVIISPGFSYNQTMLVKAKVTPVKEKP